MREAGGQVYTQHDLSLNAVMRRQLPAVASKEATNALTAALAHSKLPYIVKSAGSHHYQPSDSEESKVMA